MSRFIEVGKVKIGDNKNVVVSMTEARRISLAQQLEVNDNGKQINIFMKNAINIGIEEVPELIKVLQTIVKTNSKK